MGREPSDGAIWAASGKSAFRPSGCKTRRSRSHIREWQLPPRLGMCPAVDAGLNSGHGPRVTEGPSQLSIWLFRLVAALWLATAVPTAILSFFLMELPFWPHFGPESTPDDIVRWAAVAAWFYITPISLIIVGRRWNGRSTS